MTPHRSCRLAWCAVLALACAGACAQEPAPAQAGAPGDADVLTIVVTDTARPAARPYRTFLQFMDAFERAREHAPHGEVYFQLYLPPYLSPADVKMRVMGDTVATDVPIAGDASFVLARDPVAARENAVVRIAARKGTVNWSVGVRTPGVPAGMRRLGDLRAMCETHWQQRHLDDSGLRRWLAGLRPNPCTGQGTFWFAAPRPVAAIHFRSAAGDTDIAFKRSPKDRSWYALPLEDQSWPDDTLVMFDYDT